MVITQWQLRLESNGNGSVVEMLGEKQLNSWDTRSMFVSLKSISVVETSRRMVSLLWQDATCYRLIDCTRSVSEGNLTANARATSCGAHRRKIKETKKTSI